MKEVLLTCFSGASVASNAAAMLMKAVRQDVTCFILSNLAKLFPRGGDGHGEAKVKKYVRLGSHAAPPIFDTVYTYV